MKRSALLTFVLAVAAVIVPLGLTQAAAGVTAPQNITIVPEVGGRFWLIPVPVLGNMTPVKQPGQVVERAMPACALPMKTLLWFTWPDTSKVCVDVWPIDVTANAYVATEIFLNGVAVPRLATQDYHHAMVDAGGPIALEWVIPAGYAQVGKRKGFIMQATGGTSYLGIFELVK